MNALTPQPGNRRKSMNAAAVGHEVVDIVRKGARKKIVMAKIIRKHGYAESIARHPDKVTGTESYKEVVDPVVAQMKIARDALVAELIRPGRIASFKKEKLDRVSTTLKNLTHDMQLLSGGQTENTGIDKHVADLAALMDKIKANKKK